jgi:hypothetical protein
MSEMIEHVAKAICASSGQSWEASGLSYREICTGFARAAIEAMLGEIAYIIDGRGVTHKNFKIVYKSDAALNQTDSEDGK